MSEQTPPAMRQLANDALVRLGIGPGAAGDDVARDLLKRACVIVVELTGATWAFDGHDTSELVDPSRESLVLSLRQVGAVTQTPDVFQIAQDVWENLRVWVHNAPGALAASREAMVDLLPEIERLRMTTSTVASITVGLAEREWARHDSREREEQELERQRQAAADAQAHYEQALEAQSELKKAFQKMADDEAKAASAFRRTTFGIGGALVAVALVLILITPLAGFEPWTAVSGPLAISIPGLAIAGYAAKESSQHRKVSRWASVMAVQLATIRNYVAPLDPDQQRDLMKSFGDRVLGDLPSDAGGSADGDNLTTALDIIRQIAEKRGA